LQITSKQALELAISKECLSQDPGRYQDPIQNQRVGPDLDLALEAQYQRGEDHQVDHHRDPDLDLDPGVDQDLTGEEVALDLREGVEVEVTRDPEGEGEVDLLCPQGKGMLETEMTHQLEGVSEYLG